MSVTVQEKLLGRVLPPLILLLAAAIFARGVILFWPYSVDDGFITFRYARNLVSGGGPNFNPGQHAEGCTCALWMWLMTLPALLHVSAEMTAKVGGVGLTVVTGALAYQTTRRMIERDDWIGRCSAASVPLLLALLYETEANATNAMETSFFVMAVTLVFYLSVRVVQAPSKGLMTAWAVSALIMGLTRPDGNILALVSLCGMAILLPPTHRRTLLRIALLVYVLPGAFYMAARWHYYGLPLPLPFYLKVTRQHEAGAAFGGGVTYVAGYLTQMLTAVGILLALSLRRFPRAALPPAAACALFLAFYLRVDPIMGQDYRFLVPTAPFLFAVAGVGLDGLMRLAASAARRLPSDRLNLRQAASLALPCLAGAVYLFVAAQPLCAGISATAAQRRAWQNGALAVHTRLGHVLYGLDPTGRSVLAMGDCGMCPYYSGWRTIDIFGLNDPQIARTGRIETGYVSRQNPDVVVLVSSSGDSAHWDGERTASVYTDCVVQGQYRRCAVLCSDPNTHYLWVYAKPETKTFAVLTRLSQEPAHGGLGPYHSRDPRT